MSSFILQLNYYELSQCMINAMRSLSSQLDTLSLSLSESPANAFLATYLLALTLPHLRCLTLGGLESTVDHSAEAMDFWARHPKLESLEIGRGGFLRNRWFVNHIAQDLGLLPNLMDLKVNFDVFFLCSGFDFLVIDRFF